MARTRTTANDTDTGNVPMSHASQSGMAAAGGAATMAASPVAGPSGPSTSMLSNQRPPTGKLTVPTAPGCSASRRCAATGTAFVVGPGTAVAWYLVGTALARSGMISN